MFKLGCGGNANRFTTKEECDKKCSLSSVKLAEDAENADPCELEKAIGTCRASFTKFYYDKKSKSCKEFIYSGCNGNSNRFDSQQECEVKCKKV